MIDKFSKLQQKLTHGNLDALLISSPYNIGYLTGFFGFSKTEREGYLLVTRGNMYFFASGLNSEAVKAHIDKARHPRGVQLPHPRGDLDRHLRNIDIALVVISPRTPLVKKALAIIRKEKIRRLGFEKQNLTFAEYERLEKDLTVKLIPTEHLIEELRMIKTTDEIAAIEKACDLGDRTFAYILTKIGAGVTEKELAFEIEYFIRKAGAQISFPPIVAFDPNTSIPHHVTGDQRLTTNSWILLDFGVRIENYCSDMTRTVFFGKASRDQKRMYQTVLDSQQKAFEFLTSYFALHTSEKKTVRASRIDSVARSHIITKGYPTIPHSLGHGIGLEVHEPPSLSPKSKATLKPDMVFSLEPGIYIPGVGGVRIEDLVVLEKSGPKFLTKAKREFREI